MRMSYTFSDHTSIIGVGQLMHSPPHPNGELAPLLLCPSRIVFPCRSSKLDNPPIGMYSDVWYLEVHLLKFTSIQKTISAKVTPFLLGTSFSKHDFSFLH